jgi:hypothetical protein
MVISIAMLGFGASGSFLMLVPSILKKEPSKVLTISSISFSISVFISYLIVNQIPFDPARVLWDYNQLFYIPVYYFFLSIPFFFSGLTISTAISKLPDRISYLYFSDLIGAGLGCLLVMVVFSISGGIGGIIIPAIFGLFSALSFNFGRHRMINLFTIILLLLFTALLLSRPNFMEINISPFKGLSTALRYPGSRLLDTRWNSFSRIDIVDSPAVRFAPGLSMKYLEGLPFQLGITVDGDNLNAMTRYEGVKDRIEFTAYLPSSAAFYLSRVKDVLILEPMGGLDILTALYHNAESICTQEVNPLISDLIKEEYRDFVGGIYQNEKVKSKTTMARGYFYSTDKSFDLIQLPISNTLGASSTGVYGLKEDYAFTEEAFIDYYNHLNENAFLSITRYLLPPPRTELRIVSTLLSSLERLGVNNPERHLAIFRSWGTITFLLKHNEITLKDIQNLKGFCKKRRFDLVYYFGIKLEEVNVFNRFKEPLYYNLICRLTDKNKREELYRHYLFNIKPVTDNRPFFHHFFRWNKLKDIYLSMGGKWQPFVEGAYLIPVVFLQALLLSFIFIILPIFLKKGAKQKSTLQKEIWLFLSYFFFIGAGFMFIEISLIQKFILFLSHPSHAISIVLFAILISSGMGSYMSRWLIKTERIRIDWVIWVLAGTVLFYSLILSHLYAPALGCNQIIRQFYTILILIPLGILMGMPFPLGIAILNQYSSRIIPWAWCVNGCASVLSSVMAMIIALSWGFTGTLICAAGAYLMGLLCIKKGITSN